MAVYMSQKKRLANSKTQQYKPSKLKRREKKASKKVQSVSEHGTVS